MALDRNLWSLRGWADATGLSDLAAPWVELAADVERMRFSQLRDLSTGYARPGRGFLELENRLGEYDAFLSSGWRGAIRLATVDGRSVFTAMILGVVNVPGRRGAALRLELGDPLDLLDIPYWAYVTASFPQQSGDIFEALIDVALLHHGREWAGSPAGEIGNIGRNIVPATSPVFSPRFWGDLTILELFHRLQDEESGESFIRVNADGQVGLLLSGHRTAGKGGVEVSDFGRVEISDGEDYVDHQTDWWFRRGFTDHGHRTWYVNRDTPFMLAAGASRRFLVLPTRNVGWNLGSGRTGNRFTYHGTLRPLAGTDYRGNSESDGSGVDLTADIRYDAPSLRSGRLIATISNAGSSALWVTRMGMRTANAIIQDEYDLLDDIPTDYVAPGDRFSEIFCLWLRGEDDVRESRRLRDAYRGTARKRYSITLSDREYNQIEGMESCAVGGRVMLRPALGEFDVDDGYVDGHEFELSRDGDLRRTLQVEGGWPVAL